MGTRTERDAMGPVEVPAERYWGAQTERSLAHFDIGAERMPMGVVRALAMIKAEAARAHAQAGRMPREVADAIAQAADEVLAGGLDDEFPLRVFQTGSGTQTNMNVNEVLANRAAELLGAARGSRRVHANDDVNRGQSSNDTFPTAMHVAITLAVRDGTLPSLHTLISAIETKAHAWADVVKIGRTHLQDAVPLTVGQEWGAFASMLRMTANALERSLEGLCELAIGGTAVGTGLNAPAGFGEAVAAGLAGRTGVAFRGADDRFASLAGVDAVGATMAALRGVALALTKVANDIRFLSSGPRCGLGELRLPENEPGSSIMPGKVNPTQAEAVMMLCAEIVGCDATVAFAAAQGNFQLNVMRPVIVTAVLRAARLLGDGARSFAHHAIEGAEVDRQRVAELVARSLMLVTALTPQIGYDRAAAIAHDAHEHGTTLREAALASGAIDAETFDRLVDAKAMV